MSSSRKPQLKYKKAPQAPRRFKSSYMFFSTEKHKSIRKDLAEKGEVDKMSTTDVAKMVSQAWKNLSNDEREEWEEMARKDKARFEMEKAMYTGPWKVPAKRRSQKDPNAPKRPMSAFLSFSNVKRSEVKDSNPDMGNAEVSRILAQMWKDASEDEKKEHIDKEFKLRQEYKAAIAEWRKISEDEIQAARKVREDQAMKAVLEGRPVPPRGDCQEGDHGYVMGKQSPCTEYPYYYNYSENSSVGHSHCSRYGLPYPNIPQSAAASSSYYIPPPHSYHYGNHGGGGYFEQNGGTGGHHDQHPAARWWSSDGTATTPCSAESNPYYGDYSDYGANNPSYPEHVANGHYSAGGTYFDHYQHHTFQSDRNPPTIPYSQHASIVGSSSGGGLEGGVGEYSTLEPSDDHHRGRPSTSRGFSR